MFVTSPLGATAEGSRRGDHEARTHQAKDNDPKVATEDTKVEELQVLRISDISGTERLGGLLKHYSRKVA